MAKRSTPLELILRAHGPCELLNSRDETLWASDSDDDFREEFNDEFLREEDIGDILEYLVDAELISDDEANKFVDEEWRFSIETVDAEDDLVSEINEPDDDGDDGESEYDED
jgi:hypothetical protein